MSILLESIEANQLPEIWIISAAQELPNLRRAEERAYIIIACLPLADTATINLFPCMEQNPYMIPEKKGFVANQTCCLSTNITSLHCWKKAISMRLSQYSKDRKDNSIWHYSTLVDITR
jgi:hypothetical protein